MKEDIAGFAIADRQSRLRVGARRAWIVAVTVTCCLIVDGVAMVGMSGGETSVRVTILSVVLMGVAASVLWGAYLQLAQALEVTDFLEQVISENFTHDRAAPDGSPPGAPSDPNVRN